jgi:peptide/nickel transport system substrate-binding protein
MKNVTLKHFTFLSVLIALTLLMTACEDKPKPGDLKVFRYNQAEGITSLDPAFASIQSNIWAVNQLYNGLFELDNNLAVVPSLVESYDPPTDPLVYTFKLKKGVYFHDNPAFPNGLGREVTAKDFVYTFKRLTDPKTASPGAWIFNDKVLLDKNGQVSDSAFKALDDYTLQIRLRRPFAPFLQILAMPYTFVVPQEVVEKDPAGFARKPVGTGPFKLVNWAENTSMLLEKNTKYWRKDESDVQLPYIDRVQVSFFADKNQAFKAFTDGKLDFISGIEESSKDVILTKEGAVKPEFNGRYEIKKTPYLNTEYIGFQLDSSKYENKKHPFLDKRVRQAMNYAVDRKELVTFLRNKLGIPGEDGIIPTVMPSFDSTKVAGYSFDMAKAQALLKDAGYPNGKGFPAVKLYTNQNHRDISEFLQRAWSKIGIQVSIETNSFAIHKEMVENGKATLFRGSWVGDYPDAENYLAMFYSKNFTPAGPNKTHFKNATFDDYFEKVMAEEDGFNRYNIYHKMDELVMVEAPVVVLYYDEVLVLSQKNVKGLEINAMNNLRLERVDFKTPEETAAK